MKFAEGTTKSINTMSPFLTLAYLYEATGDQSYLPWLDSWAKWAMHDLPRTKYGEFQHMAYLEFNENELWDDTLMMTVLPLAKIGLVLKRRHYIKEAKRQSLLHIQCLQEPTSGLFFHGWNFDDSKGIGHNFANARWARGTSRLTIMITDFIETLDLQPQEHLRQYLESVLNAQCHALKKCQSSTGLWRTSLNVSTEEGRCEQAWATAGFAYGIMKAVRRKYVSQEYAGVSLRAVKAVLGKISESGELLDASFGTGIGHDLEHYLKIELTSMPYGPAMAIMALVELLRMFI